MEGLIIINKPKGFTSQDVVSKTKKILNIKKAGHTGTLDPMATGVLPVLLGNYTKLSKYLIEHDKTYIATIKLGTKTTTGDSEGDIVKKENVNINILNQTEIEKILNSFKGNIKQYPPMYSAIKVNGKKLYEYARAGENIELKLREVTIYDIELIKTNLEKLEIEFKVSCSKGTYIRTLCEDIASKLGTVGFMSSLKRISVDKFKIEDSVTFEELENKDEDFISSKIFTMEQIFSSLNKIILPKNKENLFLNGVMLNYNLTDGLYNIYNENNIYFGTGIIKNKLLKRDVIINQ